MTAIGAILLLVGVMALAGALVQRMRAGRLAETPFAATGQVGAQGRSLASPKGALSTQGQVQTTAVLTSPVSGAPCVYYAMKLEVEWGADNATSKYTVTEDKQAVPFAVNDGSGPAVVSIDPKRGGEFCSTKPFERKKFSRGLLASVTQKPIEVTPRFSIPAAVQVEGPLGRMIDVPVTATFFLSEEFLEPKGPLYVNGKLADDGSITSPTWTSLLIQNRTRDELLAASTGLSKKVFLAGVVAAPLGAILSLVGYLTRPPEPPPTPAAAPDAPAAAPAAHEAPPAPEASRVTSTLVTTGGCAALDLAPAATRVMAADDALNVVAIVGGTLHRVYVKLGDVTPGQTVDVCAIGRRCAQNLQVGVGQSTFLNHGRGVGGTITVTEFAPAAGRMNVTFHAARLPLHQGDGECVVDGTLVTTGISP